MRPDLDTVVGLLQRAAAVPDAGIRVLDRAERESRRSWRDIRERASGIAGGLQALGVAPGETVALVFPTGFAFLEALFGVLTAGAVPVPLYPPARLGRLDEYQRLTAALLVAARARIVLVDPRVRRILGPAMLEARPPLGCRDLESLPRAASLRPAIGAEDLALVQFSSGTTVDPKPVALSHRALVTQARLLNGLWPDRPGVAHSGVSWLPLYHDMGLIGCVLPALERPAPLTLLAPEDFVARPASWLRALSRYGATVSAAPNFAYALCTRKVRDEEMEGVDLSRWEIAINGAETVVPEVVRAFASRFARWGFHEQAITPVYGLSESALAVTFSEPSRPFRSCRFDRAALASGHAVPDSRGVEIVALGRPLRGFELAVGDERGGTLEEGRVGRVRVRGPSLMRGYLHRPEATAEAIRDGWLETGDLGFVREGELYLVGRDKDILIVNGRNHAPDPFERSVAGVRGARPGCAVAVAFHPESAETEEVLLLIEAAAGASDEERAALPERCAERALAATGVRPSAVVVLEPGTLPRTSSGKLRRQEALRRFLEGRLDPPRRVTRRLIAGALARSSLAYLRGRLGGERRDG